MHFSGLTTPALAGDALSMANPAFVPVLEYFLVQSVAGEVLAANAADKGVLR